jgi:hypothetical protein
MTCGPWKPITVESHTSRISEVRIHADVAEDLSVELSIFVS